MYDESQWSDARFSPCFSICMFWCYYQSTLASLNASTLLALPSRFKGVCWHSEVVRESLFCKAQPPLPYLWDVNTSLKKRPMLSVSMSEWGKAEKKNHSLSCTYSPVKAGMLISVTSLRTISAAYYRCSPPPSCCAHQRIKSFRLLCCSLTQDWA